MEKLKMWRKKQRNGDGEWTTSFAGDTKTNAELRKLTNSPGWVAASRKVLPGTKSPGSSRASTPSNISTSSSKTSKKLKKKKNASKSEKKFKMVLEKDEDFEVDYVSPDEGNTEDSDSESKGLDSETSDDEYSFIEEDDVSSIDGEFLNLEDDYSDVDIDEDYPPLELPESSKDLLIPNELLLTSLGVYEVLRHFRSCLRLSPMLFEDFCAALMDDETNILLTECYLSVLKALLREEDAAGVQFGPPDQKDSVQAAISFLDHMTWPEVTRAYLQSMNEHHNVIKILENLKFPRVEVEDKLMVLKTLTDIYLASNKIRDQLMTDGVIRYDDNCRVCHKLGDLLCCETCPAVYHLACCDPPLIEVPDDEWQCEICVAHKLNGVYNCEPKKEFRGQYLRHDPIGVDRHGNKYWFLSRRLIIEGSENVWYYSTQEQFNIVRSMLDPDRYEMVLCEALKDVAENFPKNSKITHDLTQEALPDDKPNMYLDALKARVIRENDEKKKKAEEEKRKLEEEEKRRLEEESKKQEEKKIENLQEMTKSDEMASENGSGEAQQEPMADNTTAVTDTNTEVNSEVKENTDTPPITEQGVTGSQPSTPATATPPVTSSVSTTPEPQSLTSQGQGTTTISGQQSTPVVAKVTAQTVTPSGTQMNVMPKLAPTQAKGIQLIKLGQSVQGKKVSQPTSLSQLKTLFVLNKDGTRTQLTLGPAGKLIPSSSSANSQSPTNRQILVLNSAKVALPKVGGEIKNMKLLPGVAQKMEAKASPSEVQMKPLPKKILTHEEEAELYFRLGEDKAYRQYVNHYTENTLALNKHQHKEERDRERYLSYKFSMSGEGEFKWIGEILGSEKTTLETLRSTLLHLEHQIPLCFMHTKWERFRKAWGKIVMTCDTPQRFAAALGVLEMATRVVVKKSVWKNSNGLPRMKRVTASEKEEWDKKRKHKTRYDEEESNRNAVWCKYTIPVKSGMVWKVRGEEYRMTGYGGWIWISTTRTTKYRPYVSKPYTLVVDDKENQNKAEDSSSAEQNKDSQSMDVDTNSEISTTSTMTTQSADEKVDCDATMQETTSQPEPIETPIKNIVKSSLSSEACDIIIKKNDVINVSDNLSKHSVIYNKKWSASKIDILLGWRIMQNTKEEENTKTVAVSNTSGNDVTKPVAMITPVAMKTDSITTTTDVKKPTDVTMVTSIVIGNSTTTGSGVQSSITVETKTNDALNQVPMVTGEKEDVEIDVLGNSSQKDIKQSELKEATEKSMPSPTELLKNTDDASVTQTSSTNENVMPEKTTPPSAEIPEQNDDTIVNQTSLTNQNVVTDAPPMSTEQPEKGVDSNVNPASLTNQTIVMDKTTPISGQPIENIPCIKEELSSDTEVMPQDINMASEEVTMDQNSENVVSSEDVTGTSLVQSDGSIKATEDTDQNSEGIMASKDVIDASSSQNSETVKATEDDINTTSGQHSEVIKASKEVIDASYDQNSEAVVTTDNDTNTTSDQSSEAVEASEDVTKATIDQDIEAVKASENTVIEKNDTSATPDQDRKPIENCINDTGTATNILAQDGSIGTETSAEENVVGSQPIKKVSEPNDIDEIPSNDDLVQSVDETVPDQTTKDEVGMEQNSNETKNGDERAVASTEPDLPSEDNKLSDNVEETIMEDQTIATDGTEPSTNTNAISKFEPKETSINSKIADDATMEVDKCIDDVTNHVDCDTKNIVTTVDSMNLVDSLVDTMRTTITSENETITVVETCTTTISKTTTVTKTITTEPSTGSTGALITPETKKNDKISVNDTITGMDASNTMETGLDVTCVETNTSDIGTNATNTGTDITNIGKDATNNGAGVANFDIAATDIDTNATDVGTNADINVTPVLGFKKVPVVHIPKLETKSSKKSSLLSQVHMSSYRLSRMSRARRVIRQAQDGTLTSTQKTWKLQRYRKTSTNSKNDKSMKLPLPWKFCTTKQKKKSIFRLPASVIRRLAISGGRWVYRAGFTFGAKWFSGLEQYWLYPCPRPTFGLTWRYKLQNVTTYASAAHLLRVFWHAIKWDKMTMRPQTDDAAHSVQTDSELITTELLKRKDNLTTGLHSEYFVRRITVPIVDPEEEAARAIKPAEGYTPSRKGLRSSRRSTSVLSRPSKRNSEPRVDSIWVPEEQVELWQIRQFDIMLKQQNQVKNEITSSTTSTTSLQPSTILQNGANTFITTPSGGILPTLQNIRTKNSDAMTISGPGFNIVKLPLHQNAQLLQNSLNAQQILNSKPVIGKTPVQKILIQPSGQQYPAYKQIGTDNQQSPTLVRSQQTGTHYIVQGGKLIKPIIIKAGPQVISSQMQSKPTFSTIRSSDLGSQALKFKQQPPILPTIKKSPISITPRTPTQVRTSTPQYKVTLSSSQLSQLLKIGSNASARVSVSLGQGRTGVGRIQLIPPETQVTPSSNQQLMQAKVGGEVRKFLITLISENAPTPASPINEVSLKTASLSQRLQQIQKQQFMGKNKNMDMKKLLTDKDPLWGSKPTSGSPYTASHDIERPRKRPPSKVIREEGQRQSVVAQVMKSILDRIDRKEEMEMRKRKREEALIKQKEKKEQTEQMKVFNRQSQILHRHRDQLKQDILKRRAVVEKYLTHSAKNELREDQRKHRRGGFDSTPVSKRPKKTYGNAIITSAVLTENNSKRPINEQKHNQQPIVSKKKRLSSPPPEKHKMISTKKIKDTKLYCVCKTPYDSTKFYIGCDLCMNWFHGSCVGIPETRAKHMNEWVCDDCTKVKEEPAQELYCVCRTPYDDSKFYIGCDVCQDWYHGYCVGISEQEADKIEYYACPRCKNKKKNASSAMSENLLTQSDQQALSKVIRSLRAHKMAWPFLQPVSKYEVPNYHRVIKKPMDLGTVMTKLSSYTLLSELVGDVSLIFDNCRMFNGADSALAKCAEIVESVFVGKIREFRSRRKSK